MRKINVNNQEELKQFKMEITGFTADYGFPYRIDDFTDKGANYTVFCPVKWKNAFPPAKLHKMLRNEVDADKIHVEYIDFVKEGEAGKDKEVYIPLRKVCKWMRDNHIHYPNTDIQTSFVIEHFKRDMKEE